MRELMRNDAIPCPFCGEHDLHMYGSFEDFFVQCVTCTTTGPNGADEESALHQWNNRQSPVKVRLVEPDAPLPITPKRKVLKCLDGVSESCMKEFMTTADVRVCAKCRELRDNRDMSVHGEKGLAKKEAP